MDPHEIATVIALGETYDLELKREFSSKEPESICKEVAALASVRGGRLLIGIDDNGIVFGVQDPKRYVQQIEAWIAEHIDPVPLFTIQVVICENKNVIVVTIDPSLGSIYLYKSVAYVRIGTQSVPATAGHIEHLVAHGRMAEEFRFHAAQMLALEKRLMPANNVAAAIFGQGELATLSYPTVRDRIFAELTAIGVM